MTVTRPWVLLCPGIKSPKRAGRDLIGCSSWVPSIWQGPGNVNQDPRVMTNMYGSRGTDPESRYHGEVGRAASDFPLPFSHEHNKSSTQTLREKEKVDYSVFGGCGACSEGPLVLLGTWWQTV